MAIATKSQQVARQLGNAIKKGRYSPGQRIPTELELCTRYKVSAPTIRSALTELAHAGMVERRQGAGTFVLPQQGTANVVVIGKMELLSSPAGYGYQVWFEQARHLVEQAGYRFVSAIGQGVDTEPFVSSLHMFDQIKRQEISGVLSTVNIGTLAERITGAGIPLVSRCPGTPLTEYAVVFDYQQLARAGVQRLQDCGYDDYLVIMLDMSSVDRNAVAEDNNNLQIIRDVQNGRDENIVAIPYSSDRSDAVRILTDMLRGDDRPGALFFMEDSLCDVALQIINQIGLRVPEDIAILTQSSTSKVFHFDVPLECLEFDLRESVMLAWQMLDALIQGSTVEEKVRYMHPHLVAGKSLVLS